MLFTERFVVNDVVQFKVKISHALMLDSLDDWGQMIPLMKNYQISQGMILMRLRKRWTRDRKTRGDGAAIADSFEVLRVTEVQNQVTQNVDVDVPTQATCPER